MVLSFVGGKSILTSGSKTQCGKNKNYRTPKKYFVKSLIISKLLISRNFCTKIVRVNIVISTLCKNAAEKMHSNVLVLMANTVTQIYVYILIQKPNFKALVFTNFSCNFDP